MQPTEPHTPSPEARSADAPPSAESSAPSAERASPPAWWQRLLHRGGQELDQTEQEVPAEAQASTTRTLTEEEFQRAVQAETDRREAKRKTDTDREARRKLRDEDPWAYAEQDRKVEQQEITDGQVSTLFSTIGAEHDRFTIDPVMQALPKADQQRILGLEGAGVGLEGRKLLVSEALKVLEKHWKAEGAKDAEAKLRKNPAFRKQLLSEMRGTRQEPEFLPGATATENTPSVSDILRGQLGSRRGID